MTGRGRTSGLRLVDGAGVPVPLPPSSRLLARRRVEAEILDRDALGPGRHQIVTSGRFTNHTLARRWADHQLATLTIGNPRAMLTVFDERTGWRPELLGEHRGEGWRQRDDLGAWVVWP